VSRIQACCEPYERVSDFPQRCVPHGGARPRFVFVFVSVSGVNAVCDDDTSVQECFQKLKTSGSCLLNKQLYRPVNCDSKSLLSFSSFKVLYRNMRMESIVTPYLSQIIIEKRFHLLLKFQI
jgi:hypothetical protein